MLIGNIDDDADDNDHYDGLLCLPKFIIFDNGSKGRGDLLFLYYLQKLTRKSLLIDDHTFLGREYSYYSRAFRIMGQ